MKPKQHRVDVMVQVNGDNKNFIYFKGKRLPVQVGVIKLAKGTLYLEYFSRKVEDFMFVYINPGAVFKTNVYPDTVMEFSLV
ncbi:MAG: hypothetical protein ACXABY_18435 [Candidatus Thorarchaeota archaeon]|jgi:hypothetical protein